MTRRTRLLLASLLFVAGAARPVLADGKAPAPPPPAAAPARPDLTLPPGAVAPTPASEPAPAAPPTFLERLNLKKNWPWYAGGAGAVVLTVVVVSVAVTASAPPAYATGSLGSLDRR